MKKLLVLLLCLAMTVGLFAGCASGQESYVPTGDALSQEIGGTTPTEVQEDAPEQALTLVYDPDRTMNPYDATSYTNRVLFSLIYQGLFTVDRNYNVEPMLCKNYSVSSDMSVYTFYINNATFSDGTRLTADDVEASLEAAWESDVYGGRFTHIIAIYQSWDGGVVVEADTTMENLPLLLDIPILKKTELDADRPLGTGPYRLEATNGGLRLVKRNNWWCQAALPITASAISLTPAGDPTEVRDMFEFSDVGLAVADPGSDVYADYRCDYELWDCENGIFLYLGFNTVESEVFSNREVRAAVTYAINRELLVEEYYRGFARSATLPCSPQSPFYNQGLADRYEYDNVRFAQTLTSAGMRGKTVRMLVNSDDSLRIRVAQAVADMLEECGLYVELVKFGEDYMYVLEGRSYYSPETQDNEYYDLYIGQTKLSPNMDLTPFFYEYGSLTAGGIADTATYALCSEALANSGNYYNVHERVMEQGYICPLLFRSYSVYATRGLLTGLTPSRDNVFYYSIGQDMGTAQVPVAEKPEPTDSGEE